jgi:hypothetical protein
MVGKVIIARIPALDAKEMSRVKLHGVEANGIWIESQGFTDAMMQKCHLATPVTTLLLFVPFHRIEFIVGSIHELSLSEKAFGL